MGKEGVTLALGPHPLPPSQRLIVAARTGRTILQVRHPDQFIYPRRCLVLLHLLCRCFLCRRCQLRCLVFAFGLAVLTAIFVLAVDAVRAGTPAKTALVTATLNINADIIPNFFFILSPFQISIDLNRRDAVGFAIPFTFSHWAMSVPNACFPSNYCHTRLYGGVDAPLPVTQSVSILRPQQYRHTAVSDFGGFPCRALRVELGKDR